MVLQFVEGHSKRLRGLEKFFGHFQPLHPRMNTPACITSPDSFPVTQKSNSGHTHLGEPQPPDSRRDSGENISGSQHLWKVLLRQ